MEINQTFELFHTVGEEDLASALSPNPEDKFPPVFATSRMIGLMEFCAAGMMKPLLKEGELSVGVGVDIKHIAPTPLGEKIVVKAEFLGQEHHVHRFKVIVSDKGGVVGKGEHTRAIVNTAQLMETVKKRIG